MMERGSARAVGLASVLLLTLFSSLIINVSAEVREESSNFISPVGYERFSPGWMDASYIDARNEEIDVRFYYPSTNGGQNVPLDCSWAPYPWIAFHGDGGEGFDDYSWIGEGLSKAGYFVTIIGEERAGNEIYRTISDHSELIGTMGYINLTGDANKGPAGAQGCIDMDHWGVAGHGLGAGLATVVSSYWGTVFTTGQFQPPRALFGVGLDTDDIGTEVTAIEIAHPAHALFLTGTMDTVAPIDEHAEPLLDQWNSGWQLLEVVGANHVQYEDDQSFLDNLFDGDATMTEAEQQQHAINKIKPYLDLTLKGNDESWYAASSRENNPDQPSDPDSYLSENLTNNQFYRVTQDENIVGAPTARANPTLFFDSLSNRTILAAGWGEGGSGFSDMWTLDLFGTREWEEESGGPTSIGSNAFASDGWAAGLLSGGSDAGDSTLWRWNGWSSSWVAYPENTRPDGETGQSLVWDSLSSRYISYGGYNSTGAFSNETWAFDPSAAVWQNLHSLNSPRGIAGAAMFFSEGWNRSILFGGMGADGNLSNETWMFNGETNSWSKLQLPGSFPSARMEMATSVDNENKIAYIYGGLAVDNSGFGVEYSRELWSFNLNTLVWNEVSNEGIKEMSASGMAYDNASNNLVVFGGNSWEGLSDETWLYNLSENEWELHSSSSAITSTDVIHISATVTERDLDSPPNALEVHCQVVGETAWVTGNWDNVNDTASCNLSPFSLSPGFHTAVLRVLHEGQRGSIQTTFERANAPPQLEDPMPSYIIEEEGEVIINASEIAIDVDGHELRFIGNEFTFAPLHEGDAEPELDYILQNDRRRLKLVDLADWSGRSGDTWYTVCGEIRDESTPGNPPARVPFCFELMHQSIDDPFVILEHPTFTMTEDQNETVFDLAPYVTDEELDSVAIHWDSQLDYNSENIIVSGVREGPTSASPYTSNVSVEPSEHWHGEEEISFCMRHYGGGEPFSNDGCVWMNVTFIVTSVEDEPIFNYSQITLDEDSVSTTPLSEIVWDPDGDEINITVESGEIYITVDIWHEMLRITPEPNWFGRSINWAIVAKDVEHEVRQPFRITVQEIDDETLVEWDTPTDMLDNMTELRFQVSDLDSDGPWLVEYYWDDSEWKEISPACSNLTDDQYECQADLLTHDLSYGDHKLYLRINDGESISEVESFWLEKVDPNGDDTSGTGAQGDLSGFVFIIGGILLLLGAGALMVALSKRNEFV